MNTELTRHFRLTFSRDETMAITGITTSKLAYLEKKGIIEGLILNDVGNRPPKRYTFRHLIEIKTLMRLREILSLQKLTEARDFMQSIGRTGTFHDKQFLVCGDEFKLIERTDDKAFHDFAVSVAGKNKGQLSMILIDIDELIGEIRESGGTVVDFPSRLPVEYAA